MAVEWIDCRSEISVCAKGERCDFCGGTADPQNPLLLFSAIGKPEVAVHRRCYIHWAFRYSEQDADSR